MRNHLWYALSLAVVATLACQAPPFEPPGAAEAIDLVWHGTYGRTEHPPYVEWVTGDDLNCASGIGFLGPQRGERTTCGEPQGDLVLCTLAQGEGNLCVVGLSYGRHDLVAWTEGSRLSDGALAHELWHSVQHLRGVYDPDHRDPEFGPGRLVDRASQELRLWEDRQHPESSNLGGSPADDARN